MGRPVDYALIYRLEDERFARERAYVCPMWDEVKSEAAKMADLGTWDRVPSVPFDYNGLVWTSDGPPTECDAAAGEIDQCTECGHTRRFHLGGPGPDDPDYGCFHGSYLDDDGWLCYPCNCGNNTGR